MAGASQMAPRCAFVSMLAGMLLLGFAGTLIVMKPSAAIAKEASHHFLQGNSRRLQPGQFVSGQIPIDANTQLPVNTYLGLGTTTTTMLSAFDSSDQSSSSAGSWSSLDSSKSIYSSSGSLLQSGARVEGWLYSFGAWSVTVGGQLVTMIIFAFFYHKNAIAPIIAREATLDDKDLPHTGEDDFENGICGCMEDPWVVAHGICCPLVRIAATNELAGICGFWETAICFFCCAMFSANLGPCCLMVYWRRQVKDVMGIDDHLINDICCTVFCSGLSLCQQAIAVDRAMGYESTGCCKMTKLHPELLQQIRQNQQRDPRDLSRES